MGRKARHSLFGARAQLSAFDDYACDGALPDRVRALAGQIAATREQIARNESENPQSAELLRYQHEELSGAGLSEGLWQELQTEHRRLSNFEQYRAGVDQISALLDGDDEAALSSRLHRASALAAELREHDDQFRRSGWDARTRTHRSARGWQHSGHLGQWRMAMPTMRRRRWRRWTPA